MNKIQETIDKIKNMGDKDLYNERHLEWANILQEPVDKATAKNVILYTSEITNSEEAYSFYTCPECRHYVDGENYCPNCGQKLDWSDEDDK